MEVHHHPNASHQKWTHYLWEFLMLFLAVFCGFLAENIREHTMEHSRAKEFSKSLLQDLQNDTAAIHTQVKSAETYITYSDSLLKLYKAPLEGRHAAEFCFYTRFMYWTTPISWNRATFEQIKNSGGLRYFKNYKLLDKLVKYDALINEINAEFNNNQVRGNMLLTSINSIIEPEYHRELSKLYLGALDTLSSKTIESLLGVQIASLENKRDKIKEMLNMIVVQQRNLRFGIDTRLRRAEELAIELMNGFKNEYHLE